MWFTMKNRRVEHACYLTLAVLAGIVLMCTVVHVMRHHLLTRDYISTQCSTTGVKNHGRTPCIYDEPLLIGDELTTVPADSFFRCVQVDVSYENLEGVRRNGIIYKNVFMVSDGLEICSYKTCGKSELTSNAKVQEFVDKWRSVRVPGTLPCFYNPNNMRQVIDRNPFTYDEAIHAMLWSVTICILPLIVIFVPQCSIFEK